MYIGERITSSNGNLTKQERVLLSSLITFKMDIYCLGCVFGAFIFKLIPDGERTTFRSSPFYADLPEPTLGTIEHIIWRMTRNDPHVRPTCEEIIPLIAPAMEEFGNREMYDSKCIIKRSDSDSSFNKLKPDPNSLSKKGLDLVEYKL